MMAKIMSDMILIESLLDCVLWAKMLEVEVSMRVTWR